MKLENIDLKQRVRIGRYILWIFLIIATAIIAFFLLSYLSLQLGPHHKFDSFIKKFIIINPYTKYINPLYIILIQFILDWGGITCILSTALGLLLIYIIHKSSDVIPFIICFLSMASMHLLHFFSMQYLIFTNQPYPWSPFTWWENRLFIGISLIFPPIINLLFKKYKTYSNSLLTVISLLIYSVLIFTFLYFGIAIELGIEKYDIGFSAQNTYIFIPIFITVFAALPLLILEYKKTPSFFINFLILAIIPYCLGELYTIFKPQEEYYTSLNFTYFLQLITFLLPLIGIITDSRMLYYELEIVKNKARQNIAAKNSFISSLSIQLQTPIKQILGYGECLFKEYDGPINEKQKLSLSRLLNSGSNLSYLISNIIDISKIESGTIIYSPEEVNLVNVLQLCVEVFSPKATNKKLQLYYKGPLEKKLFIIDPKRLKQIIFQLLDNAIKFTSEGTIILSLEETDLNYTIKVIDSGIGIQSGDQEKIFLPYFKENKETSGIGIGLPIAKKITTAMNGTLAVESQKNNGSTFILTLNKTNQFSHHDKNDRQKASL